MADADNRPRPLKPYQRELLELLAHDFTIDQIVRRAGVNRWTLLSRIKALHRRYGTMTRLALVLSAIACGDLDGRAVLARYRNGSLVPAGVSGV